MLFGGFLYPDRDRLLQPAAALARRSDPVDCLARCIRARFHAAHQHQSGCSAARLSQPTSARACLRFLVAVAQNSRGSVQRSLLLDTPAGLERAAPMHARSMVVPSAPTPVSLRNGSPTLFGSDVLQPARDARSPEVV